MKFATLKTLGATLVIGAILLSTQVIAGPQEKTEKRNLVVDDLFNIADVRDPQLSPEGKWVAYAVSKSDLKEDKSETRIWMAPTTAGAAIPMTAKGTSASSPRWSPDGTYLSFLADRNDSKRQVWGLNRQGGEAQQLTFVKQGVEGYEWSPDGKQLLLVIKDPKLEELKKDEKKKKRPRPWVIDRQQFKQDYAGYLDRRREHLYQATPGDSATTQLTSGDYDDSEPAWSPDGRQIAFVSNRTSNADANDNTDIWIVSAETPDAGKTLIQVTSNPGADTSPAWRPDGKALVYVTVTQPELIWYATNHLATISVQDRHARVLTEALDRNVTAPRFAPDGKSIYFIVEDSGERQLAKVDLSGKNLTRLVSGEHSVRAFSMTDSGALAALITNPHLPAEVFLLQKKSLKQLTRTNADFLAQVRLADIENIHFQSKDGTEIEGFIYKPPGFDATFRYPTLLRIHGGPVSQYDFRFNFEAQLFCAQGYLVVMTNPRGSSGYGQEFSMGIYQDWGNKDFEDVMAGVDYAVEKRMADPQRLGVGGWSYGGILTNYVITKTDRFKGAISGASEVLYVANYGHDHYQHEWEAELGLPWENRELWERLSPFNAVEKIVTPTLIMGGEKDWNVPILNSEQLYQALIRLGRTTQLVVYPDEHHGISRPTFRKDRLERYLAWYDKYVKGEPKTESSSSSE